jgi:hypothetical protein
LHIFTKTLTLFLFLIGIVVFVRCKDEPVVCTEKVGSIACGDFQAVTPPTYEQVLKCYEDAIATSPQQRDSLLARSIFSCVKVLPVQNPPEKALFDLKSRLCPDEWKLVILYPRKAYAAIKNAVDKSLIRAKLEFPEDADVEFKNSKADAFRLAYLGVLMAQASDTTFARRMALARLSCSGDTTNNRMDVHNDTVGVGLVRRFRTATETELVSLLLERRYYYIENPNSSLPADVGNALAFYSGRRTYDVAYKGTLTNPDGPGTWNAIYYFNQSGNSIRGEAGYTINKDKSNERFKGKLNGSIINLDISYPYAFELSPGYYPCKDVKSTFTIKQDSLQGT